MEMDEVYKEKAADSFAKEIMARAKMKV